MAKKKKAAAIKKERKQLNLVERPTFAHSNKAIFIDKLNRQELSIKIDSRVFSQNYLDLKKYWDIILS